MSFQDNEKRMSSTWAEAVSVANLHDIEENGK